MELPEYGNRDDVTAALNAQDKLIACNQAELNVLYAERSAIQQMCNHEYRPYAPENTWEKCQHCGDSRRL